jgi:hypothetical protein
VYEVAFVLLSSAYMNFFVNASIAWLFIYGMILRAESVPIPAQFAIGFGPMCVVTFVGFLRDEYRDRRKA